MDAAEVLTATSAGELGPIAEILRDQSFLYANLFHDARARTLALSVERRFPPRKGNWVLELRGVGGKTLHRPLQAAGDTVKDLSWDAGKREVVLRGVVDEIRVTVDSLDLRASRFDAEAGAKRLTFDDLPEDFRKEVREQRAQEVGERSRIQRARRMVRWKGALAGGASALLVGAFQCFVSNGNPLVDFLVLPAVGLATMYVALGQGRSRLLAAALYGLPCLAVLLAGVVLEQVFSSPLGGTYEAQRVASGKYMIAFFGGLFLSAVAQAIAIWIRGEEEDLV